MAAADARLTATPGVYGLGLRLDVSQALWIGALGSCHFPAGYYVYVGSAWGAGGLAARVRRHLRGGDVRRWHIDYLRAAAAPFAVWLTPLARDECVQAARLLALPDAELLTPGFGASDCRCPGHLIFMGATPPAASLLPDAQYIAWSNAAPGAACSRS